LANPSGCPLEIVIEVFEENASSGQVAEHPADVGHMAQRSLQAQTIKSTQDGRDFVSVALYEGGHGVLLRLGVFEHNPFPSRATPFQLTPGRSSPWVPGNARAGGE
jgi:hypothetical protein